MSSEKLDKLKCPCCGSEMEAGFIVGHWIRLRWSPVQKTQTIFAGSPLMKKRSWMYAPTVSGKRCRNCRIGVFSYDNE